MKATGRAAESEAPQPGLRAHSPCAFTLVELLVVIGVIALLAGLILPVYQRVMESGRSTACISNLRQLGIALSTCLAENNNTMPVLKAGREKITDDVPVIDNTFDKYVKDRAVFSCPADPRFAAASGTSYIWNVALNGQAVSSLNFFGLVDQHSRIPILADKEGFHPYTENKVNILYADGHATKDLKFLAGE